MKKNHTHLIYLLPLGGLAFAWLFFGLFNAPSGVSATHKPQHTPAGKPSLTNKDSFVVRTSNPSEVKRLARGQGLKVLGHNQLRGNRALITIEGKLSQTTASQLEMGSSKKIIDDIAPNYTYRLTASPNDTNYSDQWALPKIKAPETWDLTTGSSTTTIAVLDTGILSNQSWGAQGPFIQPDFPTSKIWTNSGELGATALEGVAPNCTSRGLVLDKSCNNLDDDGNNFIDDWRGWDFMGGWRGTGNTCPNSNDPTTYNDPQYTGYVSNDNDPQPYSCDDPQNQNILNKDHYNGDCGFGLGACFVGHGTSVASVAAAATNNASGVAGLDWNAKLMNLRVLDGYGAGNSALVASGIEYAIASNADVINMSLALFSNGSCSTTDTIVEDALARAKAAGIVIVAASGNSGGNGVCYPARSPHVLAVGSSDRNDNRSSFSTYGQGLDVIAPGSDIVAANAPSKALNSNIHPGANGTSLATPHVAGLAALMKGISPSLSSSAIDNIIKNRADKVPGMQGKMLDEKHGHGRINAHTTISVVQGKRPVYRLYRPAANNHFYTSSVNERNTAVNSLGYRFERIEFWSRYNPSDTTPIYRLYRTATRSHLYTADKTERDRVAKKYGFRYEGVKFNVFEQADASSKQPVYRSYRPKTNNHFYTSDKAERDRVVEKYGFRYEGVGFNAE